MRRILVLVALLASTITPAACQDNSADARNLRAIVEELRQLRRDLRTTTVATQRVQIALYRAQLQDAAVARATRVVDETQSKLAAISSDRAQLGLQIDQIANRLANGAHNEVERKELEQALPVMRRRLEGLSKDAEHWEAKVSEAETQLVNERAKLDSLHSLLDELDQALERIGRGDGSTPRDRP